MAQHFLRPRGDGKSERLLCYAGHPGPPPRLALDMRSFSIAGQKQSRVEPQGDFGEGGGGVLAMAYGGHSLQVRGSGLCLQGPHVHTGQAEPGWWQLLALAVLVEADVEEEVTCVEEEEGPKAGRLA